MEVEGETRKREEGGEGGEGEERRGKKKEPRWEGKVGKRVEGECKENVNRLLLSVESHCKGRKRNVDI